MKRWIHILALVILASSCKSVEKMVEQGKYDEAIVFAAKKLHGKKKKKTKYVEALETAYDKVMRQDLDRIASLMQSDHQHRFDRAYDMYQKIEHRQNKIRPFLPLISEDGYTAHFKFVRVGEKMNEVGKLAAKVHYDEGVALLAEYDQYQDKRAARKAYRSFGNINDYMAAYEDSRALKQRARQLGVTTIGLTVGARNYVYAGDISTYVLQNFNIDRLNSFWTQYHISRNGEMDTDYEVIISVDDIDLGREQEVVDRFHEKAFVEVGRQNLIDENGNTVKDSLGNVITVPLMNEVRATITEVKREKSAYLRSNIIIKDRNRNVTRRRIPVQVQEVFSDIQCTFVGDERALPKNAQKRLDNYLAPFPHDIQMIENMSYLLRDEAYKKIEREMRGII